MLKKIMPSYVMLPLTIDTTFIPHRLGISDFGIWLELLVQLYANLLTTATG
jgi:hypothetical protein